MKTLNQILFSAVIAATLGLANQASAQLKAGEDDGIAATPRVRQMMNERKGPQTGSAVSFHAPTPGAQLSHATGLAASPKLRQMLEEQRPSTVVAASSQQTSPVAETDGIAASPKVRQQLNERGATFMIAPIK
jgi:hypothetical protein